MSQRYSSDQSNAVYHSALNSPTSSSGPPSNDLPEQALSSAPTLPPIPPQYHGYVGGGPHAYSSRGTVMMMNTSHVEATSQACLSNTGYAPIYGPTSNTYYSYNNGEGSYAHTAERPQQSETSRPPSTHTQTYLHAQAAYPAPTRTLPEIAPMPPRTNGGQMVSYGNGNNNPQSEEQIPPSHVVGAQGRRGILPSTIGRPPAMLGANVQGLKDQPLPPKDKDGKFPCLHCEKTYLHSKHLKRHLLRHTGVRPYTCGLCTDTFSRSDILKRHFQKCSSRRGNPTGQNHLAHSRANKKFREQQDAASAGSSAPAVPNVPNQAQLANYRPTSSDTSAEMNNLNLNQQSHNNHSNQVSRDSSVTRSGQSTGSQSNRTSLGMINPPVYDSAGYAHSAGHVTPDSITTSGAATPYTFQHEPRGNQLPGHERFPVAASDLSYSRPPTSSNYGHASLPHIVDQSNARGYSNEWSSFAYHSNDDYGSGQHHSGTSTPLEREKPSDEFITSFPGYEPYLGPKA